jgi:cytochrome b
VAHWLLALVVIFDWITDEPRWMHVWLGYLALVIVVLRIAWGFIGTNTRASKILLSARAWRSIISLGSSALRLNDTWDTVRLAA